MRRTNSTKRCEAPGLRSFARCRTRKLISSIWSIDLLEGRVLLSASSSSAALQEIDSPTFINMGVAAIQPHGRRIAAVADDNPDSVSAPYDPTEIDEAYGINEISFNGVTGNGAGQTIAIVDAYNDPDIISDADSFSTNFDLPEFNGTGDPTLTVLNQTGGTKLPSNSSKGGWDLEESLDVEWAHSVAPMANIVLFEANSASNNNLFQAVRTAADYSGVSAVSMSWSGDEFSTETSDDSTFTTPSGHQGVSFVAASGDNGATPQYPSVSPNVISVGGTTLTIDSSGSNFTYGSESAWSGGGGGISQYESQPSYQTNKVNGISSTQRTTPDISMDANPNSGVYVLDTYYTGSYLEVGGTSLATPMWAALIAIANQGRTAVGLGTLNGTSQTLPALYSIPYSSDFNDVTTGNNGYSAGTGYDLATGLGTPIANVLVPALADYSTEPQLAFTQEPTSTAPGDTIIPAVTVSVEDVSGDVITSDDSNVTLSIYSGPGGAVLSGTLTEQAQNGVATFSNLSINLAGNYSLQATDGSDTSAVSSTFVVGTQPELVFTQMPSNVDAGLAMSPSVTVAVEQPGGGIITSDDSTVTLSLETGTGTLSGTLTAQAQNGVATFTGLWLSTAGSYSLEATDGSDSAATSNSFVVSNPPGMSGADYAFTGPLSSQTLLISGGGVTLSSDLSAVYGNYTLQIAGDATVTLASNQNVGQLEIIGGNGTLNVSTFSMMINYGSGTDPKSALLSELRIGNNAGPLTNPQGITSNGPGFEYTYGVGYADSADGIDPSLTSGQFLIGYTLYGDITMQGVVNGQDFSILSSNFGHTTTNGWEAGDFYSSGEVNATDFSLLSTNFGEFAVVGNAALQQADAASNQGALNDQPTPISPVLSSTTSHKPAHKSKSIVPDVATFAIRMPAVSFNHRWLIPLNPRQSNSKS